MYVCVCICVCVCDFHHMNYDEKIYEKKMWHVNFIVQALLDTSNLFQVLRKHKTLEKHQYNTTITSERRADHLWSFVLLLHVFPRARSIWKHCLENWIILFRISFNWTKNYLLTNHGKKED